MAKKGDSEWQLVTRRNRTSSPASAQPTPPAAPQVPLQLIPYSSTRPTFAQVLSSLPRTQHISLLQNPTQNPTAHPMHNPTPPLPQQAVQPQQAAQPQQPSQPQFTQPHSRNNSPPIHYPALLDQHIKALHENLKVNIKKPIKQYHARTTKQASPPPPPPIAYVKSPYSPTTLKYPPYHRYPEWVGRCFNCMERGHKKKLCGKPPRCAACWGFGHTFDDCTRPNLHTTLTKLGRQLKNMPPPVTEPDFQQLLLGPHPTGEATLPDDRERPASLRCFISRDTTHFQETEHLTKGFLVTVPADIDAYYSPEFMASYLASVSTLKANELAIAPLHKDRFLVMPPVGTNSIDICNSIPDHVWDLGFVLPTMDAIDRC